MIARLWWKDARQFGPIWGAVALMALIGYVLTSWYMTNADGRDGVIWGFALLFTGLYALAIASAALAGERENGTLRLLDALPAPRRTVWDGKVSFAVVTTAALAVLLLLVALMMSDPKSIEPIGGPLAMLGVAVGVVALMLEAIGWGLLWSALLNHVLAAAGLAVASVLMFIPIVAPLTGGFEPTTVLGVAPYRLVLALVLAGASRVIFLASGPPHWSWNFGLPQWSTARLRLRAASDGAPAAEAPARRRAGWPRALLSLAWQAHREARQSWLFLALLGLGVPIVVALAYGPGIMMYNRLFPAMYINLLVALLAGVGVFHAEQRGRAFRVLAHHGVRPAFVWPIKVLSWVPMLLLIWLPYVVLLVVDGGFRAGFTRGPNLFDGVVVIFSLFAACFAVGLLMGQAIPRGITAALVGFLAVLALVIPTGMLIGIGLLSPAWTFAAPLALLAVSWAWTGPWMLDRPGASKWLRLLGLFVLFFGPLLPIYIALRAWSIPDPGPLPDPYRARIAAVSTLPEQFDAMPLYRRAYSLKTTLGLSFTPAPRVDSSDEMPMDGMMGMGAMMGAEGVMGFEPAEPEPEPELAEREEEPEPVDEYDTLRLAWLDEHEEILDLLHQASAKPLVRFGRIEGLTLFNANMAGSPVLELGMLLHGASANRRELGDLDGAWADALALLRIGHQQFDPMTVEHAITMNQVKRMGFQRAIEWALDDRHDDPERLREALKEVQALTQPVDPVLIAATELIAAEQTLDLPRDTLRAELTGRRSESLPATTNYANATRALLITTPWELERARRAFRVLFGQAVYRMSLGPIDSALAVAMDQSVAYVTEYSPLVRNGGGFSRVNMIPFKAYEVDGAALVQILALRAWQLSHDGRLPERLEDLVPSELDRLPADPYRPGQPFGYVLSHGQKIPDAGSTDWGNWTSSMMPRPRFNHRLLYSVGPDGVDNQGESQVSANRILGGDLVYPIPDHDAPADDPGPSLNAPEIAPPPLSDAEEANPTLDMPGASLLPEPPFESDPGPC